MEEIAAISTYTRNELKESIRRNKAKVDLRLTTEKIRYAYLAYLANTLKQARLSALLPTSPFALIIKRASEQLPEIYPYDVSATAYIVVHTDTRELDDFNTRLPSTRIESHKDRDDYLEEVYEWIAKGSIVLGNVVWIAEAFCVRSQRIASSARSRSRI